MTAPFLSPAFLVPGPWPLVPGLHQRSRLPQIRRHRLQHAHHGFEMLQVDPPFVERLQQQEEIDLHRGAIFRKHEGDGSELPAYAAAAGTRMTRRCFDGGVVVAKLGSGNSERAADDSVGLDMCAKRRGTSHQTLSFLLVGGPFKPLFGLSGGAAHSSRFWLEWGNGPTQAAFWLE